MDPILTAVGIVVAGPESAEPDKTRCGPQPNSPCPSQALESNMAIGTLCWEDHVVAAAEVKAESKSRGRANNASLCPRSLPTCLPWPAEINLPRSRTCETESTTCMQTMCIHSTAHHLRVVLRTTATYDDNFLDDALCLFVHVSSCTRMPGASLHACSLPREPKQRGSAFPFVSAMSRGSRVRPMGKNVYRFHRTVQCAPSFLRLNCFRDNRFSLPIFTSLEPPFHFHFYTKVRMYHL